MKRLLDALNFAAVRHRAQRRKGRQGAPYVNHLIEVANLLVSHGIDDEDTLVAAVLHDSIEDVGVQPTEIRQRYGDAVCDMVVELTDNMNLPTWKRKLEQIDRAPTISCGAQQIKIADKISNLRGILMSPPASWSLQRKLAYYAWSAKVVEGCTGAPQALRTTFDEIHATGTAALQLMRTP